MGHDEYLYHLLKPHLPEPALYMIRYHSFYAWHREEQYGHLTDERDRAHLHWVRKFNPYDLYSKNPRPPVLSALKPLLRGPDGQVPAGLAQDVARASVRGASEKA